ncbi:MAG: GntR family transcriptional regulator [Clostridiales bacterium]|nr:GntR family transcriptional regulator [Clostridiales bacterium]
MISVDYRSRTPLYRQLVDNIEDAAARGFLPPDSQLPSVRSLAMELSINPNTIQRAYTELERRGVIYSLAGRGSFVCGSPAALLQAKRERLLSQLADHIREGLELGLTAEELLKTCHAAAQRTANSKEGSDDYD